MSNHISYFEDRVFKKYKFSFKKAKYILNLNKDFSFKLFKNRNVVKGKFNFIMLAPFSFLIYLENSFSFYLNDDILVILNENNLPILDL